MTETTANASRIGRFSLIRRLGRDSIATVYRARDSRDSRDVAIKLLHSQFDSSAALQAIRDEQLDQVRHPAICRLYSVDQHQGLSYLAYEYAHGKSLARILAAKGLRGRDKLPLMRALVEGLAALHEHGKCHLGVTPARIKVATNNTPKILGIGRSSLIDAAAESTIERSELRYMAPEQLESGAVGERTDVFRLCLVLFEILTHKPALNPSSKKDALERLASFALPPDSLGTSQAAMKLMAFLNKGLAVAPDERYRDAIDMLDAMPKVRVKRRPTTQEQPGFPTNGIATENTKTSDETENGDDAKTRSPVAEQNTEQQTSANGQAADEETTKVSDGATAKRRASLALKEDTADDDQSSVPPTSAQDASATEADSDADAGSEDGPGKGDSEGEKTIAYILDRLANSNDFPALSQSVFEVNQLTSLQANATVSQIAEVILRDYALSNELLKLANSAYYGVRVEVTRVTDAIRLLGFEQVRITANGLAYTAKIGPGMEQLRDAMLKSFASGLVSRQLAEDVRLNDSEEAFLCAMFHDTGEHLTIHYLPDEHARVTELLESGQEQDKSAAATKVLGLTFASLGAAVARSWRFPEKIVTAIEGETEDGEPLDDPQLLQLSWIARGANDLCELAGQHLPDAADAAMEALVKRVGKHLPLDSRLLKKALYEAAEKAQAFAPVLGIDANKSDYMRALAKWGPAPSEDASDAAPGETQDLEMAPDNDRRSESSGEQQNMTRNAAVS